MSLTVAIYGVAAELPKNCAAIGLVEVPLPGDFEPIPVLGFNSEEGRVLVRCIDGSAIEVFAATAACRWRDIHEALIDGGSKDGIIESYQQVLNWQKIRRLAIKDQNHA